MQVNGLLDTLTDAKEYGSILTVDNYDWDLLRRYTENSDTDGQMSIAYIGIEQTTEQLKKLIDIGEAMAQKYDAVVTNPPYMGASGMGAGLSKYIKEKYPDSKSDLFAVFIERCEKYTKNKGYQAMITQHAWMFLSSFEKLRTKLLSSNDISTMVHLGARAFEEIGGEVVQTTSFVLNNRTIKNYKGKYCRLIEPVTQYGKEKMFLEQENRYTSEQTNFSKIPGSPVAYWVSDNQVKYFKTTIENYLVCKTGLICGNNDKYIRFWFEINKQEITFECKNIQMTINKMYFPYNHGGKKVKWYGSHNEVVLLGDNAFQIRKEKNSMLRNSDFYFKSGITWNRVGNGIEFAARIVEDGFVFDDVSPSGFSKENIYSILGYMNSKTFSFFLGIFSNGLKVEIGHIKKIPFIEINENSVKNVVVENINIARKNWDSYELSWDFEKHPLI